MGVTAAVHKCVKCSCSCWWSQCFCFCTLVRDQFGKSDISSKQICIKIKIRSNLGHCPNPLNWDTYEKNHNIFIAFLHVSGYSEYVIFKVGTQKRINRHPVGTMYQVWPDFFLTGSLTWHWWLITSKDTDILMKKWMYICDVHLRHAHTTKMRSNKTKTISASGDGGPMTTPSRVLNNGIPHKKRNNT